MKLYTEEQVRTILDLAKLSVNGDEKYSKDELLESLTHIELPNYDKVTRFEVIDHTSSKEGRILVRHSVMVDVSIQDEGMTMKVFLTDKYQS